MRKALEIVRIQKGDLIEFMEGEWRVTQVAEDDRAGTITLTVIKPVNDYEVVE